MEELYSYSFVFTLYAKPMHISLIAAMATNRAIGFQNQLPWHYSEDLQHFKTITSGQTIVMGYNTYLSIGRPLPNRRNIVLSSKTIEGVECFPNIPTLIAQLEQEWVAEIFIIWGASIYAQFLPLADQIYLTQIKKEYQGDTFFPVFEEAFMESTRDVHEEMDFILYKKK